MGEEGFQGLIITLSLIGIAFVIGGWGLNQIADALRDTHPELIGIGNPLIICSFGIVLIIAFNALTR